jgi:hypothetical protein
MSRKNKRGNQKPQIRKSFALIVDGDNESWYIDQLKKQEKDILTGLSLHPALPQKKKLEDLYELIKKLENEGYDKIFWIIDFDTIIKEAKEAKAKLCKFKKYYKELEDSKKIIIIVNNPCLEYWFLQHFTQTSKYFNSYEDLKKDIKKHIKDYDKTNKFYFTCNGGKGIYSLLKPYLKTAILNSKKLAKFTFDETEIENYETGVAEMYKLFEELKIANTP